MLLSIYQLTMCIIFGVLFYSIVPEQAESKSRIIEFTFDEGVTDPQVNNICLFL